MRIGITQRVAVQEDYAERRDILSQEWTVFFRHLKPEATLIPIPNKLLDPVSWAESLQLEALILSNGNDWGEAPDRDDTESKLFHFFMSAGVPIIGICRGMQVINLLSGGGIDLRISGASREAHVAVDHPIFVKGEGFVQLLGGTEIFVNSFHGSGVLTGSVAPAFEVFATTAGSAVEGIFHKKLPILGIQWHPERYASPRVSDINLMRRFLEEGMFW